MKQYKQFIQYVAFLAMKGGRLGIASIAGMKWIINMDLQAEKIAGYYKKIFMPFGPIHEENCYTLQEIS